MELGIQEVIDFLKVKEQATTDEIVQHVNNIYEDRFNGSDSFLFSPNLGEKDIAKYSNENNYYSEEDGSFPDLFIPFMMNGKKNWKLNITKTLRKPTVTNQKYKPVIIYENKIQIQECLTIQEAAKWLKQYLNYSSTPYRIIENGIFYNERFIFNNNIYEFTTDKQVRLDKLKASEFKAKDTKDIDNYSNSKLPFKVGQEYSRKDIYEIINVPEERQKGNWNTGYNSFNNDIFIFANINSAGRTGHDYDNKFIGDNLQWFSKNNQSLDSPTIQAMLHPVGNIYIFTREDSNNTNFIYQGNASPKEYKDTKPVRIIWEFKDEHEVFPNKISEEIDNPKKYKEGSTKKISVNIYERNPVARSKCLEHYGYSCVICDFNFEITYGNIGKDFIHVHHLVELSEVGEEYEIDPITDLRPVCPNCHAMLHKKKPAYSINELMEILDI